MEAKQIFLCKTFGNGLIQGKMDEWAKAFMVVVSFNMIKAALC